MKVVDDRGPVRPHAALGGLVAQLLPQVKRLRTRADAAAVAAENCVKRLLAIQRELPAAVSRVVPVPALDGYASTRRDTRLLRAVAINSPIESLQRTGTRGRRSTWLVNGKTTLVLGQRLGNILHVLRDAPAADDDVAAFVRYDTLRKELFLKEGRQVRAHSLSQSLFLLSDAFEAAGLNSSWIDRDSEMRRVRLLIRKPHQRGAAAMSGLSGERCDRAATSDGEIGRSRHT